MNGENSYKLLPAGVRLLAACMAVFVFSSPVQAGDGAILKYKNEPITPIPLHSGEDPDIVSLGRDLFHDPRLSTDDTVSCAFCHPIEQGGMDGLIVSVGVEGRQGPINTPTVLNSGLHFVQFWDGRSPTLEAQIDGPTHSPLEMASNWPEIVQKLNADDEYKERFAKLYPEKGIHPDTIRSAIATYERYLLTPNSPFDRFLRGEDDALSQEAKQGYVLFKGFGCSSCHQGVAVGGNMYEKLGVFRDYFKDRGNITKADWGRYNVTGVEEHKFEFKVPSLRNIELTAPYFHDGAAKTLQAAVKTMAKYQLGRSIKDHEVELIVAFLKSLTGEIKP
ncbi:cytochrome-c peroxidase [Terasakiella sp. SH-1]|uniref:cytochrome-c peroxidase n=1 Tax=Terasakiella sp. SH-1 TaxID=2560057 RepID=UPI00197D9AC8|nr:cytochrome-c peroxidase [Terasakiella sp. SH-1]